VDPRSPHFITRLGAVLYFHESGNLTSSVIGATVRWLQSRPWCTGLANADAGELGRLAKRWDEHPDRDRRIDVAGNIEDGGLTVRFDRLLPCAGSPRASSISVVFPDDVLTGELAAFSAWAVDALPLWWGCSGLFFVRRGGWGFMMEDAELRTLARRYWGVQVLDPVIMQWDALTGIAGGSWITIVGSGLPQKYGTSVDAICEAAAAKLHENVFYRRGSHGVVLAAGSHPVAGDINRNQDIAALAQICTLLRPVLLHNHGSMAGKSAQSSDYAAHLLRFLDPDKWIGCDIHAE
jgi:hypothetical protein